MIIKKKYFNLLYDPNSVPLYFKIILFFIMAFIFESYFLLALE